MSRDLTRQRAGLAIDCAIRDLQDARALVREMPQEGRIVDALEQLDDAILKAQQARASVKSR